MPFNLPYQLRCGQWAAIVCISIGLLLGADAAGAQTYVLAPHDAPLVGGVQVIQAGERDTLIDVARAYSLGYGEMRQANPEVEPWLPGNATEVVIPSRFILPHAPREGIVLNRGEMRLYYFHEHASTGEPAVTTYPVGIGRIDRQTPVGRSRVAMKLHKPAWYPTENVRADYAARGETLAAEVPAGPDNPLGEYALVLDTPGYLIHGTNRPDGIGMRVSQGCVRLYPEHIKELVARVEPGTPVTIVDQPQKVAIVGGRLMIEVHPSVYPEDQEGVQPSGEQYLIQQISKILEARGDELRGEVDWSRVTRVYQQANGMPMVVTRPKTSHLPTGQREVSD